MKRILPVFALLGLLLVTGCAGMPGTNTGALVGGVAGAALSRDNPIAGAVIGGVGGALLGNLIDNSDRHGFRNDGYRRHHGNSLYDDRAHSDRAYYERLRLQRAFEQQRAHEQQMRWLQLQQQRQWEQQRYYGGRGCWRC